MCRRVTTALRDGLILPATVNPVRALRLVTTEAGLQIAAGHIPNRVPAVPATAALIQGQVHLSAAAPTVARAVQAPVAVAAPTVDRAVQAPVAVAAPTVARVVQAPVAVVALTAVRAVPDQAVVVPEQVVAVRDQAEAAAPHHDQAQVQGVNCQNGQDSSRGPGVFS